MGYHQISGGVPLLAHHGWLDHPLKKINWGIIDVCSIYIHTYTCIDIDIYIYFIILFICLGVAIRACGKMGLLVSIESLDFSRKR